MTRNISIKNLTVKKNVGILTIDRETETVQSENELKALAILLGGYNKYGRNINLDIHRERITQFCDLLQDIVKDIE